MKLHHVAVVCSSLEKADRFYQGILELEKIKTSTLSRNLAEQIFDRDIECQLILYSGEALSIEVFLVGTGKSTVRSFEHICLQVKNRETFLKRCQVAGLKVNRIPKGDSTLVFIEDFDGNLFEIKELAGL